MLSPIMIPSSTRIPMTIIIPKRLISFMVIPITQSVKNIPRREIGIPRATQKAALEFKKIPRSVTTNINPSKPFWLIRVILSCNSSVSFMNVLKCTSPAYFASYSLASFSVISTTSTTSSLLLYITLKPTDLLPLYSE